MRTTIEAHERGADVLIVCMSPAVYNNETGAAGSGYRVVIERTEIRRNYFREDYPDEDDSWLKTVIFRRWKCIEIIYLPDHTDWSAVVYIPGDRTLFTEDLLFLKTFPLRVTPPPTPTIG